MAVAKTKGQEPKFLNVTNVTDQIVIIPPDDREVVKEDIVLQPRATVSVTRAGWLDSGTLTSTIEAGRIVVTDSDVRARPLPLRPSSAQTGNPKVDNMIWQIVFGEAELAKQFINATPTHIARAGQPMNVEWLKTTGWALLNGALDWLRLLDGPEFAWRMPLIEKRLAEIRLLV
jgi:hypothetical protein